MRLGIVIGRFQTINLHEGHQKLIAIASNENDKLLVFLGVDRSGFSTRNPLDYKTRQVMFEKAWPNATVLPLPDMEDDESWSKNIERLAYGCFYNLEQATIYGGRDSCLPHYKGKFKIKQIDDIELNSSTAIRKAIGHIADDTQEFRHGCIYTTYNTAPRPTMCTDVALVRMGDKGQNPIILLGTKPGETLLRFPGGKMDLEDESLEMCARRELQEETGIFAEHMEYIASFRIDDWRWKKNPDNKAFSALFLATEMTLGEAKAGDDLAKVTWCEVTPGLKSLIRPSHQPLYQKIENRVFQKQLDTIKKA